MVQKVGEINQIFELLKIHQTISNSNQNNSQDIVLMKMDKSGPKNFGSLIWKGGSGVLTTISVSFRYFPKLSRYLYDHKAIKLAARYHKFEIKQFLCLSIFTALTLFWRKTFKNLLLQNQKAADL